MHERPVFRIKRTITLLAVLVMLLGVTAVSASAHEQIPPHGHLFVLGLQLDETGEPVGYRKCVDLANNQALRLNAHHEHIHFGKAGDALRNAGHVVVPATPFGPFDDCAHLAQVFGPPTQ
jgi:hypothetical protein